MRKGLNTRNLLVGAMFLATSFLAFSILNAKDLEQHTELVYILGGLFSFFRKGDYYGHDKRNTSSELYIHRF